MKMDRCEILQHYKGVNEDSLFLLIFECFEMILARWFIVLNQGFVTK